MLRDEDLARLRLRPALQAADADAVTAALVRVPADPDAVLPGVGGDARVPVVGLAAADLDRVVPAVAVGAAGVDRGLAVPEALPHQPRPALLVGRHAVPEVRTRARRQLLGLAELAVLVGPGVQVPPVRRPVLAGGPLRRPHDPERLAVGAGQGDAEVVPRAG